MSELPPLTRDGTPRRICPQCGRKSVQLEHMETCPMTCPDCGAPKSRHATRCVPCGHRNRHKISPGWAASDGYRYRPVGDGTKIPEHRWVMERELGRPLRPDEHVHHRNEDKQDNRIENLELVSPQEHMRRHTRHDWQEVARLYSSGLSSIQTAAALGINSGSVSQIVRKLGLSRTFSEAARARPRDTKGHFVRRAA